MTFWFPVFLVLFEFATYVSNDMAMPAMPAVVGELGGGAGAITLALSVAMFGNVALQWLLGPLSDCKGRRVVMLAGAALFVLSCMMTWWVQSMHALIALRFVQGMGVAFVMAVGYPAVHEAFDDVRAVKAVSAMTSVALFAPLLGPLLGALVLEVASWRAIFLSIAVVAAVAWAGMAWHMPRTPPTVPGRLAFGVMFDTYRQLLGNALLMRAAFSIGALCTVVMTWIALGPVIFMARQQLQPLTYAVLQLPVLGGLSISFFIAGRLAGRVALTRLVATGLALACIGAIVMIPGRMFDQSFSGAVPGFVLYALGVGASYTGLYRLALFSSRAPKGAVAATINSVFILTMIVGIETLKHIYLRFGDVALLGGCAAAGLLAVYTGGGFINRYSPEAAERTPVAS